MAKLKARGRIEIARAVKVIGTEEDNKNIGAPYYRREIAVMSDGAILAKTQTLERDRYNPKRRAYQGTWKRVNKMRDGGIPRRYLDGLARHKGYTIEVKIYLDDLIFNSKKGEFEKRSKAEIDALIAMRDAARDKGAPAGNVIIGAVPAPEPLRPTVPEPSLPELERMMFDGIAEAIDGCRVEPDGKCQHGAPSWLVYKGLI